jgi:hypothetical protein
MLAVVKKAWHGHRTTRMKRWGEYGMVTTSYVLKGLTGIQTHYIKVVSHTHESYTHEGNTMRKIMGNKPQVSSAIIIQSSANILE